MERTIRQTGQKILLNKPEKNETEKKVLQGKALHILELNEYMKTIPEFKGAHYLNELSNFSFPSEKLWGLIILLPPPTPNGKNVGHFIAMVFDTLLYHEIDFFDSFGRDPFQLKIGPEICKFIARFLLEKKPLLLLKMKVNTLKKQFESEARCGTACVQFLLDRLFNKKTFKEATGFSRKKMLNKEEEIIEKTKFLEI